MATPPLQHAQLEVKGHIQGVNFRNTVRHLAYPLGLKGYALNDEQDEELVHVVVEGAPEAIDKLIDYLQQMKMTLPAPGELAPPRSLIHVETIKERRKAIDSMTFNSFSVRKPEGIEGKLDDVINKLDYGATVYASFHQDHNQNFFTLRDNFGAVTESINRVGDEITAKIDQLIGTLTTLAGAVAERFLEEKK